MRPLPVQNQFDAGMKRDMPRNRMPPNSAWNLVDILLNDDAPMRERGGSVWFSDSATSSVHSKAEAGIQATFSTSAGGESQKNIFVSEDGNVFTVVESEVPTLVGAGVAVRQNPIFHGGTAASAATAVYTGLVIFPDSSAAAGPKKYDGTTLSNLGGSPPRATLGTIFKDYTVLARGFDPTGATWYGNRVWFSPPGDPDCAVSGAVTAWDTTDSWIDFPLPVVAVESTNNVILAFLNGEISRVRGTVAPPEEDMVVDHQWQKLALLGSVTTAPSSVVRDQDYIYFAAREGVFRTDGVSMEDITQKGGMLSYWQDTMIEATTAANAVVGIVRNNLFVLVYDNKSTILDGFIVNMANFAWTRFTNIPALSFWAGERRGSDELFFGSSVDAQTGGLISLRARVGRLGTLFEPGNATYKNDASDDIDVTRPVAAVVETPFYEFGRPGIKIVKALFAGFFLKDYGTDNPTIAVSYVDTPESESYTSIGTLSESTEYDRRRLQIGGRHWGMGFKFTRANAGDFFGFDLSAEVGYQEESKRLT